MNNTKIYPNFWSLFLIYIPVYSLTMIIFYFMIGGVFPPTLMHYLILGGWTLVTALYLVFGYKKTHYELTKHELVHYKGNATLYYPFKDIVYIDKVYSERKRSMRFFTSQGDERYLMHDKNKVVYKTMLTKATNVRTLEEFKRQYPKIKL